MADELRPVPMPVPSFSASSASSSSSSATRSGPPTIVPVGESNVLARARAFLPQMMAANRNLEATMAQHGADAVRVDHVPAGQQQYIEMDLACGVLDMQAKDDVDPAAVEQRTHEFLFGAERDAALQRQNPLVSAVVGMNDVDGGEGADAEDEEGDVSMISRMVSAAHEAGTQEIMERVNNGGGNNASSRRS